MEYEILVIIGLSSCVAFVLGSWFSPMVKTLKKEVQYWRGIAGKQAATMNNEKKESGIEGLLGDSPLAKLAKPLIEKYMNNPAELQKLLGNLGGKDTKTSSSDEWR